MNKPMVKIALVALLVAAALAGRNSELSWKTFNLHRDISTFTFGLLAFSIFNAVFSPPGTMWVRATVIAGTLAGLLWSTVVFGLMVVLTWMAWPPAFMVTWALGRKSARPADADAESGDTAAARARITLAAVIGAVAIASGAYRWLIVHNLQQTSALFIGLPALVAIVVVLVVSPRSATGVACKATTVGLLVSLIFLWEGALCVAMSAPLFYSVAIGIASTMDAARRRRDGTTTTLASCLVVLVAGPMSLEGVAAFATLNRAESVAATKIVHASSTEVERVLFEAPRFERGRPRPLLLRMGFPSPVTSRIDRTADRTRWVVEMRGGEMLLNGMESRTGDLVLDLEETQPGLVRWRAVSDASHMTHFLTFRESVVEWQPIDAQTTRVTWTLRYDRGLDPAWYFGPIERYAARLAAGYLIDAVATP